MDYNYKNLTQLELLQALTDFKSQGKSVKEIAGILEKSEGSVKNLLTAVNIINREKIYQAILERNASVTMLDIKEVHTIPKFSLRAKLLEQKAAGKLTRAQFREKIREAKGQKKKLKHVEDILNTYPDQTNILIANQDDRTITVKLESSLMYRLVKLSMHKSLMELKKEYGIDFSTIGWTGIGTYGLDLDK